LVIVVIVVVVIERRTCRSWRLWMITLGVACFQFGTWNMVLYYFIPLFIYATWLTVVTFLHHHDPDVELPWFAGTVFFSPSFFCLFFIIYFSLPPSQF
jgi:hypothetical protein